MPHASERDKRNNLKEVKFLHDYPHPNIVKFRGAYEVPEDHEIWVPSVSVSFSFSLLSYSLRSFLAESARAGLHGVPGGWYAR
jgi:hypothetical protein